MLKRKPYFLSLELVSKPGWFWNRLDCQNHITESTGCQQNSQKKPKKRRILSFFQNPAKKRFFRKTKKNRPKKAGLSRNRRPGSLEQPYPIISRDI
jgi:hypothetical protein